MPKPPVIFKQDIGHQHWDSYREDGPMEVWHYPDQTSTGYRWQTSFDDGYRYITGPVPSLGDTRVECFEQGVKREPYFHA